MESLPILAFLLLAAASSVQAGLSDQTFTWVDLSTGVAATVGVCVFMVGIAFTIYEFKFRDYFSEIRVNGQPYALDLSDTGLPDPPSTIEAKSSSDVEKVDMDEIDPPMEVAFVSGD